MSELASAAGAPAAPAVIYSMGFDHDMVQHALEQAGGNEQLAINLIINGEVYDVATASSSAASIAAPAASFSGPASGLGATAQPPAVESYKSIRQTLSQSEKYFSVISSSSKSNTIDLSSFFFPDHLIRKRVSLRLDASGIPLPPPGQRAHIMRPLELMQAAAWFFARQSPGMKRHWEEPPPPFDHMLTEFSPCVPVRVMCGCVATACRRLATAPAGVHVMYRTTGRWAGWIMERVTRGRVKKVQHTLAEFQVAAAARIVGMPNIVDAVESSNFNLVFCHLVVNCDCVNFTKEKQKGFWRPPFSGFRNTGKRLLHWSSEKGDLEICRLLLQCNADVQAKDDSGWTPLHFSAYHGHFETCRLLLQCNADVEAKDRDRRTPLHLSAYHGHIEICRLLIKSKADVAARDIVGRTALKSAADCEYNDTDVAAYLRSIGCSE